MSDLIVAFNNVVNGCGSFYYETDGFICDRCGYSVMSHVKFLKHIARHESVGLRVRDFHPGLLERSFPEIWERFVLIRDKRRLLVCKTLLNDMSYVIKVDYKNPIARLILIGYEVSSVEPPNTEKIITTIEAETVHRGQMKLWVTEVAWEKILQTDAPS